MLPFKLGLWIVGVWLAGAAPAEAADGAEGSSVAGVAATSPVEMLRYMRIDASQLGTFVDDREFEDAERETMYQLLFRMPSFAQVDVDLWTQKLPDLTLLSTEPDAYRFQMFELTGQVTSITRSNVLPELLPRVGYREYFRLALQVGGRSVFVYVRSIPESWRDLLPPDVDVAYPVAWKEARIQGLFLKRSVLSALGGAIDDGRSNAGANAVLYFAAARVAWHPAEAYKELGLTLDQVLLARLGLDLSRLEEVRHRKGMEGEDRECFYQALAAVREVQPQQLARAARGRFDLKRLLTEPQSAAGELYTIAGIARRALLIQVPDSDIRARFGLDHYYEIEIFVPLDKSVRFTSKPAPDTPAGKPAPSAEEKVFTDYPFVACVPTLPPEMEVGEDIRVAVSCTGFFLKLWGYQTQFMSQGRNASAGVPLQLSPLLIAPSIELPTLLPPSSGSLELWLAGLFAAALLGTWLVLWQTSNQDRRVAQNLFRKHGPSDPDFGSLNERPKP